MQIASENKTEELKTSPKKQWLLIWIPLLFLSFFYELLTLLRQKFYQKGWFKSKTLQRPVISVGNLVAGGAGKTPVIDFLITQLKQHQIQPAVLTRGYGRQGCSGIQTYCHAEGIEVDSRFIGDEPLLLAQKHPELKLYIGGNRFHTGCFAELEATPDLFLLDDAYQHIQLNRDLNLLLIDAPTGMDNGYVLPAGKLREPPDHWKRADAILITKAGLGFYDRVVFELRKKYEIDLPIFRFDYVPEKLIRLDGNEVLPLEKLTGQQVVLVSAIARPAVFEKTLQQVGAKVVKHFCYRDHYHFNPQKTAEILSSLKNTPSVMCVTTEKDAVKLQNDSFLQKQVWVLCMKVQADPEWDQFLVAFLAKKGLK